MAQIIPRVPGLDVEQAVPDTGLVLQGFISSAAATPAGTTYAGIFAVGAILQILAGTAVGIYTNTGSTANPAWTAQ